MPRRKRSKSRSSSETEITVSRPEQSSSSENFIDRLQKDLENRQSLISLVLGVLIVVVLGVLLFNYFSNKPGDLGPSQQTESTQEDVAKENLPGKYTVKEGDTLFNIAQNYYGDGYKFNLIALANDLADENIIEVGQVINIPKDSLTSSPTPQIAEASPSPLASPQETSMVSAGEKGGQGGATNQTIWGEKISGDTYTVSEGDWLSKIAGRAYGDIYAYDKIAQANNISDPNLIEVGMVLKIPR